MGDLKGGSRSVYDFLMSIDYGICHGPVDSINMAWVKDKRIFCDRYSEEVAVTVSLPDLFGGDEEEGGVGGVVELYMGTDAQVSSEALASRSGATSATWPGYQGLAHMFFRGASGAPGSGLFGGYDDLDGEAVSRDNGQGFKWTVNNPYMPTAKVHCTRMPSSLGANASVPQPVDIIDDGAGGITWVDSVITTAGDPVETPLPTFVIRGGAPSSDPQGNVDAVQVDMHDYTTQELIDAGSVTFGINYQATVVGSGSAQFIVRSSYFPDDGTGNPDLAAGLDAQDTVLLDPLNDVVTVNSGFVTGAAEVRSTVIPPATARFVIYDAWVVFTLPFFATIDFITREAVLLAGATVYTYCDPEGTLDGFPDANPAHIIYECLTDPEWGKGEDPANIDTASFTAAALTLYNERFGMSMIWLRQDTIQNIVQDVLDHIKAFLFLNPQTGLWTLKLLRDDYDAALEPLVDETNCVATKRKRRAWGETINEIVVSYTDPNTEDSATVGSQDDGNIALQGALISETREYSGVRNAILAKFIADRDVRESAYPVFSAILTVDRSMWNTLPGAILRFSWEDDGIVEMPVRVMAVDYGKPKDRKIKLIVVEDIFGLDQTNFSTAPLTNWDPLREVAVPFDHEFAITAPLPMLQQTGVNVDDLDADYPSVGVLLHGAHDALNAIDMEAHTLVTLGTGSTVVQPVLTSNVQEAQAITVALVPEVMSRLPVALIDTLGLGLAVEGDVYLLGTAEGAHEFIMLDNYVTLDSEWEVRRAIWDTLPGAWPIGTILWNLDDDGSALDPHTRTAGETRTWRMLPRTSEGRLAYGDAADIILTVSERPHRPFRPADCDLDGAGFDLLVYDDPATDPTQMTASWANRNRLLEDVIANKWDDATVAGEAGQDTTIRVRDLADVLIVEYTGETGTSKVIPFVDLTGEEQGYVEFIAVNAIGESLWNAKRYFDLRTATADSTKFTADETTTTIDRA